METADTPQEWEQGQWEAAKNVNDQQSCPISNAFKILLHFFFFKEGVFVFILVALGLCYCVCAFSSCRKRGRLITLASLVSEHRL